jgi:hypothetical protein
MQGPASPRKVITAELTFGSRSNDKYSHFVPGEAINGTCFAHLGGARKFHSIHVEVIGKLQLKNGYNPNPPPKKKDKDKDLNVDCILEETVLRVGYTHMFRYGEDTTRNITFDYRIELPTDAHQSFVWKASPEVNKPDHECYGSLRHEIFVWLDETGVGRTAPLDSSVIVNNRTASHDIFIFPQLVSDLVGAQAPNGPDRRKFIKDAQCRHEGRSGTTELNVQVNDPTVLVPGALNMIVNCTNRNKKKDLTGLMFVLEEISRVSIGQKQSEYRRIVLKDRPTAPFVALKNGGECRCKHAFELVPPRGPDVGCIQNFTIESPHLNVSYVLSSIGLQKGVKEAELTANIPVFVGDRPKERFGKEIKLL